MALATALLAGGADIDDAGTAVIEFRSGPPAKAAAAGGKKADSPVHFRLGADTDDPWGGDEPIARAAVESALENGSDAIFVPLFWLVVAGAPGVVLYRLANTLDAMWGYRNARFTGFGWAAARIDDVLNWMPARLTAMSYALLGQTVGHTADALRCWRGQAHLITTDWSIWFMLMFLYALFASSYTCGGSF